MKKLLFISLLALTPSLVKGVSSWELLSAENNIEIKGLCTTDVRVELYEGNNFEVDPIYVATAPCTNDTFVLSDDVLRWDIPEGMYKLVVDGERATVKDFTVKEIVMTKEEVVNRELLAKGLPGEIALSADQVFENAQASFGQKLYSLETDLVTMQEALKDTTYPNFIKIGLGGALSIVEGATKKLGEAFFVVEQRDFVDPSTSIETLETTPQPDATSLPIEPPLEDSTLETAPDQIVEEAPLTEDVSP